MAQSLHSMEESFLRKLRTIILENIENEHFGVRELANEMGYSRSQIHRKLIKYTGKSATRFIREIRLEEALILLEAKAGNVNEIAYQVGFNSPAYLTKCFHDRYGVNPGDVLKGNGGQVTSKGKDPAVRIKIPGWKHIGFFTVILITILLPAYIIFFNHEPNNFLTEGKVPLAITSFANNTVDTNLDYLSSGIPNLIIDHLSNSEELVLLNLQTKEELNGKYRNLSFSSNTRRRSRNLAKKVHAEIFIQGDFQISGNDLVINSQIIQTETGVILKTVGMRAHPDKIFAMVKQISENILDHLEIHALSMSRMDLKGLPITTKSPEAFHHFILGMENNWNEGEPQGMGSFEHFISAIEIDSTFTSAYVFLSMYASHLGDYNTAKDYLLRALMVKEEISKKMQFWIDALKKMYFDKDPYGTIENFKKSTDLDPLSRYDWLLLAWSYSLIEQHADAQAAYEQISRINHILGKWDNSTYYLGLAQTYISMGKYIKARKVLLSGQKFFPDNPAIHRELAKCALMRDQLRVAEKYFEKYRQVRKINGWKDAQITAYIGKIYYEAGMTEKALEFYDRALEIRRIEGPAIDTINPGNNLHWYYNVLAMVLLEQDLDVEKGMAYARKAYDLSQDTSYPSHPMILKRLALAFYKQGNTSEALRLLNQAEQGLSIYDHFIHQWKIKLETEIYQRNKSTQGPSHYTKMIS